MVDYMKRMAQDAPPSEVSKSPVLVGLKPVMRSKQKLMTSSTLSNNKIRMNNERKQTGILKYFNKKHENLTSSEVNSRSQEVKARKSDAQGRIFKGTLHLKTASYCNFQTSVLSDLDCERLTDEDCGKVCPCAHLDQG